MMSAVMEQGISYKTNSFRGPDEIGELLDFVHSRELVGKAFIVVNPEQLDMEMELGENKRLSRKLYWARQVFLEHSYICLLLLDLLLAEDIWDVWHPLRLILAEELSLWRHLLRLVECSPHHISKLVSSSLAVFTDVSSAVVTEFSDDTVVLLKELWLPCLIRERVEWHFGGKSIVGSECPPAALAVAESRPRIICRVQIHRIFQGTADAASLEIETHGGGFGGLKAVGDASRVRDSRVC